MEPAEEERKELEARLSAEQAALADQAAKFNEKLKEATIQRQEAVDDHQLTLVSLERLRREKTLLEDEGLF